MAYVTNRLQKGERWQRLCLEIDLSDHYHFNTHEKYKMQIHMYGYVACSV